MELRSPIHPALPLPRSPSPLFAEDEPYGLLGH